MKKIDFLIKQALKEDIGKKDLTTELLIPKNLTVKAKIIAKKNGVIAGLEIAKRIFEIQDTRYRILSGRAPLRVRLQRCGKGIKFWAKINDGEKVKKGQIIAEIYGRARTILTAERVFLNLLSHLSGIATLTRKYVDAVKSGTRQEVHPAPNLVRGKQGTRIYDTRKTTPLWRELEKYAVRCGGGYNHRMNLGEQVLIKDNHLKKMSNIKYQISNIRKKIPRNMKIEMETENLNQVRQALNAGVDIVMLDNMSFSQLREAVEMIRNTRYARPEKVGGKRKTKPEIEVSGGVNLKNIKKIVRLGIERISVGEITHSAPALDMSLSVDHPSALLPGRAGRTVSKPNRDLSGNTQIAAEKTETNLTMG